jgi:CheY-like chemotaxis protein
MTSISVSATDYSAWFLAPESIAFDKFLHPNRVLRILLAEDSPLDQEITGNMLKKLGHEVDLVGNGAEAVDAVNRLAYDLLIMDVQMPEMDGIQAVRCIRHHFKTTPKIVFVTGSAPDIYRGICFDAGGDDFISKPITILELNAAINRVTR